MGINHEGKQKEGMIIQYGNLVFIDYGLRKYAWYQ